MPTMRAVRVTCFGGPDVLGLAELERPSPISTEVLVRVTAAGVNPVDCKTRRGEGVARWTGPPPFILGWDVCGVVEAVGYGVTRFAVGDCDNRTCSMRVIGHGESLHIENRLPGADVNPYLAVAAMIAAGLHGIDAALELAPATTGSAYEGTHPRVPHSLQSARDLFAKSTVARAALGEVVVDHYVHRADIELAAFGSSITDWERFRGFERL